MVLLPPRPYVIIENIQHFAAHWRWVAGKDHMVTTAKQELDDLLRFAPQQKFSLAILLLVPR